MPRHAFVSHARAERLEDVFLTRYEWLRKRALALVSGDRPRAEDLVHDLFVELRLGGVDPDEIRDPEAYLARMLRNLHISSIRRSARAPVRALSVVDYDSLDALLSDTRDDPARPLEDAEDVRRVCLYACWRKETSKAGSTLILRFFYGYTPHATALLMRVSAGAVDQWLSIARKEARAFLREPQKVTCIDGERRRGENDAPAVSTTGDLLVSLRRSILAGRRGPCLTEDELAGWDRVGEDSVDRDRLAHVVSCRPCLEAVAARTGLPGPWDASPAAGDDGGPAGTGSGRHRGERMREKRSPRALDRGLARMQAVLDHQPQSLQILINGFLVGSQTVGYETTTQSVQVSISEPVGFVEVTADNRVRLLMMPIDSPPTGDIDQHLHRRLGVGRALTVAVSFAGPAPQVTVTYEPAPDTQPERSSWSARTVAQAQSPPTPPPSAACRLQDWWLDRSRPATSVAWSRTLARACAIVFVCWLLFGGGAEALTSTTGRVIEAVQAWISTLLTEAEWEPPPIEGSPVRVFSETARAVAPRPVVPARQPAELPLALDAITRARVELEVLRLLQPVNAYLGQEIALGATRDGKVSVEGVVPDGARQQEIAAVLRAVAADARELVSLEVATTAEAAARRRPASTGFGDSTAPAVRTYAVIANRFPALDRVRAALTRESAAPDLPSALDQQAQQFASRVLALSSRASQHSAALHNIASRVPHDLVLAMSAGDRDTFDAVIRWHAERFERDLLSLWNELSRIYEQPHEGVSLPSDVERAPQPIWTLTERLVELNTMRVHAVNRAFSASVTQDSEVDIVDTSDFRALVGDSLRIARQLRSP